MQSLELLLDPESEARIVAEWRALESAGLPSQARHTGASNRPHVTVLARPSLPLDIDGLDTVLPLRVTIGAPLVFGRGDRCTVSRAVVPTIELLDSHRRLHARVGAGDDSPRSLPGRWTPHITLARGATIDEVARVIETIDSSREVDADLVALRHWDGVRKIVTPLPR